MSSIVCAMRQSRRKNSRTRSARSWEALRSRSNSRQSCCKTSSRRSSTTCPRITGTPIRRRFRPSRLRTCRTLRRSISILDHLQVVAVGDATKAREVLAKYGKVEVYDAEGKPITGPSSKIDTDTQRIHGSEMAFLAIRVSSWCHIRCN